MLPPAVRVLRPLLLPDQWRQVRLIRQHDLATGRYIMLGAEVCTARMVALLHVRDRPRDQDPIICLAVGLPPAPRTFHSDHALLLEGTLLARVLPSHPLRLLCDHFRDFTVPVSAQDCATAEKRAD